MDAKQTPKWQIVENLIAAWEKIQERVSGVAVTPRAQIPAWWDPTVRRDVDVLVEALVGDRTIRIGIEVKAHGIPLDLGGMGQIVDLAKDVQLDHYCVASTSGYSKDAEKKAKHENVELMTVHEFKNSDFWVSPPPWQSGIQDGA
jgi:hypothetical protein